MSSGVKLGKSYKTRNKGYSSVAQYFPNMLKVLGSSFLPHLPSKAGRALAPKLEKPCLQKPKSKQTKEN